MYHSRNSRHWKPIATFRLIDRIELQLFVIDITSVQKNVGTDKHDAMLIVPEQYQIAYWQLQIAADQ